MTESPKYQYFDGKKFTRDEHTGYYLNSTIRMRMHRYVWEFYHGKIPDGCVVHHIDHNKANNSIENLVLMDAESHSSMHGTENQKIHADFYATHLGKIRQAASLWHGSEKGREWHKQHYETMKSKFYVDVEKECKNCGKRYKTSQVNGKFCSNACKSAWRRKSGTDNIECACCVCGKTFVKNKYAKTQTCSRPCAGKIKKFCDRKETV